MKTLQSHNEEMEKKFDGEFEMEETVSIGKADKKALETTFEKAKSFITNSNKQLYIKIAEGELKRLETKYKPRCRCMCQESNIAAIHNEAIQEQINYWTNILQELNK